MLITKQIEINLNPKTIKYYLSLGYKGKVKDKVIIPIKDLIKTSHYKVKCSCENCGKTIDIAYKNYIKNYFKHNMYLCHKCCGIKKIKTCQSKYGYNHSLQVPAIRQEIQKTCNIKYNANSYLTSEEYLNNTEIKKRIRQKGIDSGRFISDDRMTSYEKYKRICRNITNRLKKKLFEEWAGYDYYDNEYIKDYLSFNHTNKKYPTIDHKTSILYGFKNNILPYVICDINNLCITKRCINSSKREKCEYKK